MSKEIDQRVVEMRFDNDQFEKNVKTTIKSLDKLDESLKMDGAEKGILNITQAAEVMTNKLVSFGTTIKRKFIENVVDDLYAKGQNLIKSITVDQVTAGWTKYGDKLSSVKTIMNATGKSAEDVEFILQELMTFSDETSYSFNDMTAALGQMSAAGGDVEKLIPMITGIANATAYAGKGAAEFSRSIYNLNQSYGSGALKYQDWRSLEMAGVATEDLRRIFIDTAIDMGKLEKVSDGVGKTISGALVNISTFGDTLKDDWADKEVMESAFGAFSEFWQAAYDAVQAGEYESISDAMKNMSGNYSEISKKALESAQKARTFADAINATKDAVSTQFLKIFESIFGNINEAEKLWTDFADRLSGIFVDPLKNISNAFKTVFATEWKEIKDGQEIIRKGFGGREFLVEGLKNILDLVQNVGAAIKSAFREIFPEKSTRQIYEMVSNFWKFTDVLKRNTGYIEKIKTIFTGLFSVFDTIIYLLKTIVGSIFPSLRQGAGGVIELLVGAMMKLSDFLLTVNKKVKESKWIPKFFGEVGKALSFLITNVKTAIKTVIEKIDDIVKKIKSGEAKDIAKNYILGFVEGVKSFISKIVDVAKLIGTTLMTAFRKILGIHSPSTEAYDDAKNYILGFVNGIKDYLYSIIQTGKELATSFINSVKEIFKKEEGNKPFSIDSLVQPFEESKIGKAFEKVKGFFVGVWNTLQPIFKKIGEAAKTALGWIKQSFAPIGDKLKEFGKKALELYKNGDFEQLLKLIKDLSLIQFIKNVSKLAESLTVLSNGFDGVGKSVKKTLNSFTKVGKSLSRDFNAEAILKLSKAILILAGAFVLLAFVPEDKILSAAASLGIIIVALGSLAGIFALLSKIGGSLKDAASIALSATALVSIGFAIILLVAALKILTTVDFNAVKDHLLEILALVAMLVGVILASGLSGPGLKSFNKLAVGLLLLVGAIFILSKISKETITDGLDKMTAILILVTTFVGIISICSRIGRGGEMTGILAFSASILILVIAIKKLSKISKDDIRGQILRLAGIMLVMVVVIAALAAVNKFIGGLAIAGIIATIVAFSIGILAIVIAVRMISKVKPESLTPAVNSIIILMLGLVAVIGAVALLSKEMNGIKMIGIIGIIVSTLLGVLILSNIALSLGNEPEKAQNGIKSVLELMAGLILVILATSLLGKVAGGSLIATVIALILFVGAISVLAIALSKISDDAFNNGLLKVGKCLIIVAAGILAIGLAAKAATAGIGVLLAIAAILAAVAAVAIAVGYGAKLMAEGLELFTNTIIKLKENISGGEILELLSSIALGILEISLAIVVFDAALIALGSGMIVVAGAGIVLAGSIVVFSMAIMLLGASIQALFGSLGTLGEKLSDIGSNVISGFVNGITNQWNTLKEKVTGIFSGFVDKVRSIFKTHSPSKLFEEIGGDVMSGFANGLEDNSEDVTDVFSKLSSDSENNILGNFGKTDLSSMLGDLLNLGPTITPVLDLSNIEAGSGDISKLLGGSGIDVNSLSGSFNLTSGLGNINQLIPSGDTDQASGVVINMTINGAPGQNVDELADIVMERINDSIERREVVWQ